MRQASTRKKIRDLHEEAKQVTKKADKHHHQGEEEDHDHSEG